MDSLKVRALEKLMSLLEKMMSDGKGDSPIDVEDKVEEAVSEASPEVDMVEESMEEESPKAMVEKPKALHLGLAVLAKGKPGKRK